QMYEIENDLSQIRLQALDRIKAHQQKQKEDHDRYIKAIPNFRIGDK
ncbi:15013_t:CDS:1, partial [Racocetra persica]